MDEREATAYSTAPGATGGRGNDGGKGGCLGGWLRGLNGFGGGLRTQLEQNQGNGNLEERSMDQRGSSWVNDPNPLQQVSGDPGKQSLLGIVLNCSPPLCPQRSQSRGPALRLSLGTLVTNTLL